MGSPIVSYIIPMYNEAERIKNCIGSIQRQTLSDIEIIVVNDGSTDESPTIVQALSHEDSRIRLLNFENGGTAIALNNGLLAATGKYIAISGADDWIEPGMAEKMVEVIETNKTDLVVCDIYKESPQFTGKCLSFEKEEIQTVDLLKKTILFHYDYSVCNKLFPRELIISNEIFFEPKLRIGQDVLFNFMVFANIKSLTVIPDAFYHYVAKSDSLMSKPQKERIMSFNKIIEAFREYCDNKKMSESWRIFLQNIGPAYHSYFLNLVLSADETKCMNFKQYYTHIVDCLRMMDPLLLQYNHATTPYQKFRMCLLSGKQFRLFALLAALRHKTLFQS